MRDTFFLVSSLLRSGRLLLRRLFSWRFAREDFSHGGFVPNRPAAYSFVVKNVDVRLQAGDCVTIYRRDRVRLAGTPLGVDESANADGTVTVDMTTPALRTAANRTTELLSEAFRTLGVSASEFGSVLRTFNAAVDSAVRAVSDGVAKDPSCQKLVSEEREASLPVRKIVLDESRDVE